MNAKTVDRLVLTGIVVGILANAVQLGQVTVAAATGHPSPWWGIVLAVLVGGLGAYGFGMFMFRQMRIAGLAGDRSTTAPSAVTPTAIGGAMVNPRFDADMNTLAGAASDHAVAGQDTVVIVTGGNLMCELLDRPLAAWLRDEIDRRGKGHPFRRAVVLGYDYWNTDEARKTFQRQPTIVIGGPKVNPLTDSIVKIAAEQGYEPWPAGGGYGANKPGDKAAGYGPRVALWGDTAIKTQSAVEGWVGSRRDGLTAFLRDDVGWR